MESNQNKEKQTIELENIISQLSFNQLRFITERQYCATDKEAAENLGLKPNTISQWKHAGYPIDKALGLIGQDGVLTATEIRRRSLVKAMMVKVGGLDNTEDTVAQKAATEIIEWEMGKATNRQEVTGADGGAVQFVQIGGIDIDKDI